MALQDGLAAVVPKLTAPVVGGELEVKSPSCAAGNEGQAVLVPRADRKLGSARASTVHGMPSLGPYRHVPFSPSWGSRSAGTQAGHGVSTVVPLYIRAWSAGGLHEVAAREIEVPVRSDANSSVTQTETPPAESGVAAPKEIPVVAPCRSREGVRSRRRSCRAGR